MAGHGLARGRCCWLIDGHGLAMVGYGLCVDVHIIFFGMLGYDVVNIIFLYMAFDIDLFVNICSLYVP